MCILPEPPVFLPHVWPAGHAWLHYRVQEKFLIPFASGQYVSAL